MDRRQRKTRDAIFGAFGELLTHKRYEGITVQEIIDKANVGRSTFYAHFETKDALLKAMCGNIFDHIFEGDMCEYTGEKGGLEAKLAHILWHLQASRHEVTGILSCDSGDLFLGYLKEYLNVLFGMYLSEFRLDVPNEYLLSHLVGSFTESVKWWVRGGMSVPPGQMAAYFMKVTETH